VHENALRLWGPCIGGIGIGTEIAVENNYDTDSDPDTEPGSLSDCRREFSKPRLQGVFAFNDSSLRPLH
jgi:hypothetical protein